MLQLAVSTKWLVVVVDAVGINIGDCIIVGLWTTKQL